MDGDTPHILLLFFTPSDGIHGWRHTTHFAHLNELGKVVLEHAGQLDPGGVVALLVAPCIAGVQHLGRYAGKVRRHLEAEHL